MARSRSRPTASNPGRPSPPATTPQALARTHKMIDEVLSLLPGTKVYETDHFLFTSEHSAPTRSRPTSLSRQDVRLDVRAVRRAGGHPRLARRQSADLCVSNAGAIRRLRERNSSKCPRETRSTCTASAIKTPAATSSSPASKVKTRTTSARCSSTKPATASSIATKPKPASPAGSTKAWPS